jgi:protein-S-isoprenylcysteine O-methyltransferase Ste14
MAGAAELAPLAHGLAGSSLALAGLALSASAAWWLRAAGNPVLVGAGGPARLVDEGPYAFSRHPMLLGVLLALLGAAMALQQPALALLAALLALWADRVWIPAEEARLRQAFGGWYSDYARSVRRWA